MPNHAKGYLKTLLLALFFCSQILLPLGSATASPQLASAPNSADAPLQRRINDIFVLLQGEDVKSDIFNQNFRNAVSAEQLRLIVSQLTSQHGKPLTILSVTERDPNYATFRVQYEKSIGQFIISLETNDPNLISGFRITGFASAGSSIDEVLQSIADLPGRTGVSVTEIKNGALRSIAGKDSTSRFAIASTFKLYILAELDRQIQSGQRKWSDVVRLGPKSHPSGVSQDWPDNMPMTLQTLATLMISVSDNSATDTLIRILGQDALQSIVRKAGHNKPSEFTPFLMTRQVTALKTPGNAALRDRYLGQKGAQKSAYLRQIDPLLTLESIDFGFLTARPTLVNEIEWFASPDDIVRLFAYLDDNASDTAREIMAINNGAGPLAAEQWQYLGYKGGSEAGVMSLNFLTKSWQGRKYIISMHWNDVNQPVDEGRFLALATRLLNLLSDR